MIPKPYIDAAGMHVPEYESIRLGMSDAFRAIYGQDINLDPDTQDGQLIGVLSLALYDYGVSALAAFQSFRPDQSQGEGLSALVKINGIRRRIPTRSTVDLLLVGQAGTVIRRGQARDAANRLWDLPDEVVIPPAGQVVATATARDLGAIDAPPGTVTTVATPTRGWQTVTNPTAATAGAGVESDPELRARQAQNTALPGVTMLQSIVSAVSNLPGVTAVSAQENNTGETDAQGLPPHSFAVVVRGGDADAIARTIAAKKGPGPATFGNTTRTVVDPFGVTRAINFYRPMNVNIRLSITIQPRPGYTSDIGAEIKRAIADHINALKDGEDVEYGRLFVPATLGQLSGPYAVKSLTVARTGQALAAADVPIAFMQTPVTTLEQIELIVNQV